MSQEREGPESGAHSKLPAVGSPKSLGAVLTEVVVFVPWLLLSPPPPTLCPTPLPLLPNPLTVYSFYFPKGADSLLTRDNGQPDTSTVSYVSASSLSFA